MAITVIIEPTESQVFGLETQFEASGPFVLYGDGFAEGEWCSLDRLGPSGTYIRACNEKGVIKLGANPNMIYVDAPGSYRLHKSRTSIAASVGIQSPDALELFIDIDEYLDLKMTEIFERPDTTGIWYDPQDLTTLYQDAQGTLPVYMPGTGQVDPPVGLMLDKSQGLELGPELWSEPFSMSSWSDSGGEAVYNTTTREISVISTSTSAIMPRLTRLLPGLLDTSKFYRIHVKFSGYMDKLALINLQRNHADGVFSSGGVMGDVIRAAGGEFEWIGKPADTALCIFLDGTTTWSGLFIESISIREIKGYHAYQSTTTARPTLSGRYNLLTATETLATQSVTTAATTYTLSFSGEGTVTLSGTATGTYSAGTHTITCTAGTLTCTVDGTVTEADLRVKRDGSDLPAYQAVVDANNYDTEGFPLFLKRDRVDDDLIVQAPAITGSWAHGTIDGPVIGTVAIPAGEYHPFGTYLTGGLPNCTQWIAIDGPLSASEQAVFERYVYSKARQLIDVPQFGGVSNISHWFRGRTDITSIDSEDWDTSNGAIFTYAWYGCSGLTSFPTNFFDNCLATNFTNAFTNTNLSQESIDGILVSINSNATSNGTFNQSGGSAPSAAGEAAITAMRSRGWTVTVTGGF